MELAEGLAIDDVALDAFCRRHGIRRLALFGSAFSDRFGRDSDIDLLVEFVPDHTPGLLALAQMELELTNLIGREVDLRTLGDLSRYFRDRVIAEARPLYDAA